MPQTSLCRANLSKAELRLAILRDADLSEADLNGANLHKADLNGANLTGVDLYGTYLEGTILDDQETINSSQIANIAKADPANIQEVAASQIEINNRYYENALQQSQRSFRPALILSIVGTCFIGLAVGLVVTSVVLFAFKQPTNISYSSLLGGFASLIGGVVINAVASLNFSLYGRTLNQLTTFQAPLAFQAPLDRISRFLIANSMCENINDDLKNSTRARLVEIIAITSLENTGKDEAIV